MATRPSDVTCYPGLGEQYLSTKRLAIRRFTASVSVARFSTAGPSPRDARQAFRQARALLERTTAGDYCASATLHDL
eukprot:1007141-Prymnesium_polylepis.1